LRLSFPTASVPADVKEKSACDGDLGPVLERLLLQ